MLKCSLYLRLKEKLNCHVQAPFSGSSPFSFPKDSPSWIILSISTLHLSRFVISKMTKYGRKEQTNGENGTVLVSWKVNGDFV